ncbi:contractile injection system protein, VgrG/Pvc8 family [Pseudoalteromonas sp. MMG022]|uniref:phage late control D family protein n=1 Tax=Pseudoalteromonas sp. MMG022 TaxID=2909978 RepID=UPI001F252DC8|nr:contractile injection system protein, VgrG/Pvc8 family [Pseudoalteromonas sp. MMG022]MCF6435250.1 phage tail protein [Pseudoalteromonas sp. MMG022]
MNIQPQFSIKTNAKEVAQRLIDRVVNVTVKLKTGLVSDSCYVRFDNLEVAPIQQPKPTDIVEIAMGYKEGNEDKSATLHPLGKFEVGEFSLSGPVRSLELFGNKLLWHTTLKAPKQRSWPEDPKKPKKLGELVSDIAGEYGLEAKVGDAFTNIELPHIEQNESDAQLLTSLAEQFDAILKISHDKLIFMARGTGRSLSGQALKEVELHTSDILLWRYDKDACRKVGDVTAFYYDIDCALKVPVKVGSDGPSVVLPYVYADEATATRYAKAKHNRLKRASTSIHISCIGNAQIVAGAVVKITNTKSDLDGSWFVSEVEHCINKQGFRSHLVCEQLA